MLVERRFNLRRLHIRAPDQDHVGAPVGKVEIAFLIEPSDIAKALPAAGQRPCRGADIAIGRWQGRIATQVDLACFARTEHFAFGGERLFFFNDTATTEIYTLSLHDALPI